ncbi:unnamed protein product [Tuber melanosporum]|uniref:tRNA-splicing endonuclease subunit Sen2 n=1 Tax=Tuber melanosporum (strain Mel28) TaxID=656061 RepID=D5GPE0_TUBMM|nr:uncharacterized protein GSTUM_00011690001 [Tuber melanosporum]CAZ86302.1 unnamed protein product [Tuber melanosporum]
MTSSPPLSTTAPTRYKKPNYHLLHALPLPLSVSPLPPLIPHNPLSLIHIIIAYLFPSNPSHPSPLHRGFFHASTRSVHITDPETIKAFWNHGFFGKGNLSRSEPTWVTRRRRALGVIGRDEALTAEEVTERRRGERKEFKKERARLEKEKLDRQLAEEGKLNPEGNEDQEGTGSGSSSSAARAVHFAPLESPSSRRRSLERPVADVEDIEHLQLTLEEAFFLSFGLGVLELTDADTNKKISQKDMLRLFRGHACFPPRDPQSSFEPDDPFMLSYVVYHHFRSLGWVVKPGVKFAVDYLLYNRGPVFSHAEFGVLILPAYSHTHWANDKSRKEGKELRPWHWLHSINRVSSQVKKTVVLVFVEVPPPLDDDGKIGVADLLARYSVREVALRRWLVSRNRD